MDMPYSVAEMEEAKKEVLKVNNLENAYIRAAAWRGAEQMGIDVTGTKTMSPSPHGIGAVILTLKSVRLAYP